MDDIENLKTDANIANILQKLKSTSSQPKSVKPDTSSELNNNTDSDKDDAVSKAAELSVEAPIQETSVEEIPSVAMNRKNDDSVPETLSYYGMTEDDILPWLSKSDKDLKLIHYVTYDDQDNLVYNTVKADRPAADLAALRLKDNYLCDIDYYKSNHYVLFVKQLDSNYGNSRAFSNDNDSRSVTESALDPVRVSSDDVSAKVLKDTEYSQYIVYTDLGVADFIVKKDDLPYPFCDKDLNKWFEETSNYVPLINTHCSVNPHILSGEIRDYNYDIITMHRPGVITLDSVDNEDPNYQLHVHLKDKYSFLPLNKILECLKFYSTSSNKSYDDFRRFIARYFDVIV